MPDQIYIGNFAKGLTLNRLPFNIDNDAFPTMFNIYCWRGRAKRKRGTLFLGQLQRQIQSVLNSSPPLSWQVGQIELIADSGNLLGTFITNITIATHAVVTITGSIFEVGGQVTISGVTGMIEINGGPYTILSISPTSMTLSVNSSLFTPYTGGGVAYLSGGVNAITPDAISVIVGGQTYTDLNQDGTLQGSAGGTGKINYSTGAITINGAGSVPLIGTFSYFPGLPVLGLEDFVLVKFPPVPADSNAQYPLLLAFDQNYAYQINQTGSVVFFYSVSYYKITNNPVKWSGQDYQQFWTTNYSGALWATNNKPGFNFVNGTYTSGSGTPNIVFNFKSLGVNFTTLVIGDKLFFNEWSGGGVTINGLVGSVSDVTGAAAGNYTVTFTGNQTVSGTGIAQLLTNSIAGQDGIKWYDGDMTSGTGLPTSTTTGWVNFSPPLTATTVVINNLQTGTYYLVGALAILPFKDRLLFFSPWIQTSTGQPIQLQDTVLWSWNGTPYYTLPVPAGETADVTAYYVDQTGKGGYLSAGIAQAIVTINNNEDVLLIGFTGKQTRFVYTGNDLSPFLFFYINSELGSSATFSGVTLDRGGLYIGSYGIALTTQQSAQRIDLEIPDSVFQIQASNHGVQRVNSARDYYREWIYFTYPVNSSPWRFPTQTFLWNYRDNTWAILYENYTAHGSYRKQTHYTWKTLPFKTWAQWREPWNAGSTSAQFPNIVVGNPQGYVLIEGQGTGEGKSGTIQAISNNGGSIQITSIDHCVTANNPNTDAGDYLFFQGLLGSPATVITNITKATQGVVSSVNSFVAGQFVLITQVAGMTQINGKYVEIVSATASDFTISLDTTSYTAYGSGGLATFSPLQNQIGQVKVVVDKDNFVVDIPFISSAYFGLGSFTRLSQPLLQTKQFASYWDQGRQVRLSVQKYLMETTQDAQVTIDISLSQDPNNAYNDPSKYPPPNALIYSQVLFTCPESTNIGLTPANANLQMQVGAAQLEIWHRFNTSLIGDTFQIGLTLSDGQMRNLTYATNEIALHGIVLVTQPGPQLA